MASRDVDVKRIATSKPGTFLDVSVRYRDGHNPFGSHNSPRGFYVQVSYVETRDGMEFHVLGKGGAGLLETAARFNQKRLNELADAANNPENTGLQGILEMALERAGLQLTEEVPCVALS